jgi:hypothetical protein
VILGANGVSWEVAVDLDLEVNGIWSGLLHTLWSDSAAATCTAL